MADGISKTMFIVGIIIAILGASLISTAVSMQFALIQGPRGDKGEKGDTGLQGLQGIQGPIGPTVNFSIANMSGWLPTPAYVSEWVKPAYNQLRIYNFTHSLSTTKVLVLIQGIYNDTNMYVWWDGTIFNIDKDIWWYLSENEIQVFGWFSHVKMFRVVLWKISTP